MRKLARLYQAVTGSPFLWGVLGAAGFYALVHAGPLGYDPIRRYFTKHPVEYMLTVMFAVGLAALILKAFDVFAQRARLGTSPIGAVGETPEPAEECDLLLDRLDRLPGRRQGEHYICRIRAALDHVRRRGSAEGLDDELKYLADLDAARLHHGYGLFRVIVWAIPILGFLGTVIGITMALNSVDLQAPDKSMLQVLNGLGLKFDTTALALAMSMALMFVHFCVERAETTLLEEVDHRVQEELGGRFAMVATSGDSQFLAVRRMADVLLQATDGLVRRQAELWQTAVDGAAERWGAMSASASEQIKTAMSEVTGELTRRADVLEKAIAATGDVVRMEDALNRNLAALAGAKHFEQTSLSLAAAVNMLSARLAETPAAAPIKLESTRRSAHAA